MRGLLLTALLGRIAALPGLPVTGVPNGSPLGAASGAAGLLPIGGTAFIWAPAVADLWVTADGAGR